MFIFSTTFPLWFYYPPVKDWGQRRRVTENWDGWMASMVIEMELSKSWETVNVIVETWWHKSMGCQELTWLKNIHHLRLWCMHYGALCLGICWISDRYKGGVTWAADDPHSAREARGGDDRGRCGARYHPCSAKQSETWWEKKRCSVMRCLNPQWMEGQGEERHPAFLLWDIGG